MSESTSSSPSAIFEGCSLIQAFFAPSVVQGRARAQARTQARAWRCWSRGRACARAESQAKRSKARSRDYALCPRTPFCKFTRKTVPLRGWAFSLLKHIYIPVIKHGRGLFQGGGDVIMTPLIHLHIYWASVFISISKRVLYELPYLQTKYLWIYVKTTCRSAKTTICVLYMCSG